jgi:hypothetical protein
MEDEGDDLAINELFVQETVDPRIESVMPILSKLRKNVAEMSEVDSLAEWADSIISEKLDMDSTTKTMAVPADEMLDEAPGAATLAHNQSTEKSNLKAFDLEEMDKSPEANPYSGQGHRKDDDHAGKPQHTAKIMAAKQAVKMARKTLDKAFKGDVEENFISMAPQAVAEEEVEEGAGANDWHNDMEQWALGKGQKNKGVKPALQRAAERDNDWALSHRKSDTVKEEHTGDVSEDLDANQKRVGQLGPTEKVKNNNIGKLVGANESTEIAPELARIIEMARFKR